ncbi:MAG TPA: flagellar basal body rod protein FlgB [Bacillales bacterium]|nr:flagellar basal body rod protein FlgB [Bacillales bacterium]
MAWFSDGMFSRLGGALDRTSLREKTIAQNIANVDTPNYKAKQVVFREEFDHALKAYRTNPRHLEFSTSSQVANVQARNNTVFNNNGNNVDIDREMAALAKNQIKYNALITRLNSEFRQLNLVLKGGR